ncbi:fungal ATP synthase protein 8-domain-containing protein [Xylariaceae sp. FL0804]|nr:fungal ATP synthase protein 8-domain-containing protein [Xylariaceae sp. FL0804]
MLAQRTLRASLQTQARLLRPAALRAAAASQFSTKPTAGQAEKPSIAQQPSVKKTWFTMAAPPPPAGHKTVQLNAAMPQLVPMYYMNEIAFTFTLIPILLYVLSKYILPNQVRLYMARLFTVKIGGKDK